MATTLNAQTKITRATLKSFIKANTGNIYCQSLGNFDGMQDMVVYKKGEFVKAEIDLKNLNNSVGKYNVHLVNEGTSGGSKDYFSFFENEEYLGIEISNCCGGGVIATKKQA